ncbi:hypothetical protein HYS91_05085 [Candidatus Daviesbacteria bacterium]|nr:hypothetical protein [Candidatus Daviesbacteria bacterium]
MAVELVGAELTPQLLSDLEEVYTHLSRRPGFPNEYCKVTSVLIAGHYNLYLVEGRFELDRETIAYGPATRYPVHFWCEDFSGKIVELTGTQFNPWLNSPFPRGVVVVLPGSSLGQRFKPNRIPESNVLNKRLIRSC